MKKPVVDYRKFRINKINDPEFRHLKLLIYWPIYGLIFLFVERFYPVKEYHVMHCRLDDMIPFCEWFFIPYMLWFAYLVWINLYTLLYDIKIFKRLMWFIIITYTFSIMLYFIYPTCQELRPDTFEKNNLITNFIGYFYVFDTNTNVCPSIHVIGSLGALFASWHAAGLKTAGWRAVSAITAVMICLSTMFMKQHSAIDVAAAIPVSVIAYIILFGNKTSFKF